MIGALWTGISGLASQQTALDNEAHNIANVNTVGYKASRISFADQMYQDKIGKGSKILDAEKLYVQGSLKLTGVSYDMALNGRGFFTVTNQTARGTAETYYTRAGNFRMGDNGRLQDAAGNEVQGWAMSPIDQVKDVSSTNPNVNVFSGDYKKLLSSKIIKHSTYIETITAKATDYAETARADSELIFSGYGLKSASAKVNDIEELVKNYSTWLQRLKDTPDGSSATSVAQTTQVNFKGTAFKKEGDQIYVFIDGNKYSQNFIPVTTNLTNLTIKDLDGDGTAGTPKDQNLAASRIATYKALANKISEIPGLVAYNVLDSDLTNGFDNKDTFAKTTSDINVLHGMLEIKSLIPGKQFKVTEVAEMSGSTLIQGEHNQTASATKALEGAGIGALETARDALAKAITGNQRNVYTPKDLNFDSAGGDDFTFDFTVYDKELRKTIGIPPITFTNMSSIDEIVAALNKGGGTGKLATIAAAAPAAAAAYDNEITAGTAAEKTAAKAAYLAAFGTGTPTEITAAETAYAAAITGPISPTELVAASAASAGIVTAAITASNTANPTLEKSFKTYFTATNVNGNLVIETNDQNYDVEFSSTLKDKTTANVTIIDKNSDYSGRKGAGAEFIEIKTKIDQTSSKNGMQLRLDTLKISDAAFGEFRVDSSGLITMKQDGAVFAIGQVAIALFNNVRALEPSGDNLLKKTTLSGEPVYNLNNEKSSNIQGKTLELSTADLSESLVNLMVFQRAFEANAKSITTSDQLLNTLINLKR